MSDTPQGDKSLKFVGSSRKDLAALPKSVKRAFGQALRQVQRGRTPQNAEAFKQGGAGCMELKESGERATYRTMYVAKFDDAVYVLHSFQKKSKSGIATPQSEINVVRERYKLAEQQSRLNLMGSKVKRK
jgi:phage-related protein